MRPSPVSGFVRCVDGSVQGWVHNALDPLSTIPLELFDAAGVVATTIASHERDKGAPGSKVFIIPLQGLFGDELTGPLQMRVAGTDHVLSGEIAPLKARRTGSAAVTQFDGRQIAGYAFDATNPSRQLRVSLTFRDHLVADAAANLFDVLQFKADLAGGWHAFRLAVPRWLRIAGSGPLRMTTSDGRAVAGAPRSCEELCRADRQTSWDQARYQVPFIYHGGILTI